MGYVRARVCGRQLYWKGAQDTAPYRYFIIFPSSVISLIFIGRLYFSYRSLITSKNHNSKNVALWKLVQWISSTPGIVSSRSIMCWVLRTGFFRGVAGERLRDDVERVDFEQGETKLDIPKKYRCNAAFPCEVGHTFESMIIFMKTLDHIVN